MPETPISLESGWPWDWIFCPYSLFLEEVQLALRRKVIATQPYYMHEPMWKGYLWKIFGTLITRSIDALGSTFQIRLT